MADHSVDPSWLPEQLGEPIPSTSEHAASVCMPLWSHNVAYEEGDESVVSRLQTGYPRFLVHPFIRQLCRDAAAQHGVDAASALPFPTAAAAARCADYIRFRSNARSVVFPQTSGVHLVSTSEKGARSLGEYRQHAGEMISSRTAQACLSGSTLDMGDSHAKREIRQRVADFQGVEAEDVYLFQSGMAAIFAAWRATMRRGLPAVQIGFPYVDTFKILKRFSDAAPWFFPDAAPSDLVELQQRMKTSRPSAVFCEVPGNPLLTTPDLAMLSEIAESGNVPLIVDDTLGGMLNIDVGPFADVIATSLTKFFSGSGDVLAGSLTLVRGRPNYTRLKEWFDANFEEQFANVDAERLAVTSRDVRERIERMNAAGLELARALHSHSKVGSVFYPFLRTRENYDALRRPDGGYGALLSFDVVGGPQASERVFNALRVSKGPNLGTNFTLCCPYTILAHYDELEFAEACGVSRGLLRVSVGTEGADWVLERILPALQHA